MSIAPCLGPLSGWQMLFFNTQGSFLNSLGSLLHRSLRKSPASVQGYVVSLFLQGVSIYTSQRKHSLFVENPFHVQRLSLLRRPLRLEIH